MNIIMLTLFLIVSLPTVKLPQTWNWNPFVVSSRSLEDSFIDCEMNPETINVINISDSSGQVMDIDVNMVLETEVLSIVETAEIEVWYEVFPSDTVLTGIGLIVYDEDLVTNRDSFLLFLNDTQEEQQWWFALFRENIFAAPQGQLQSWILQEENFCGLFEIAVPEASADS